MLHDQLREEVAGNYKAVEMRLKWLKWAKEQRRLQMYQSDVRLDKTNLERRAIEEVMPQYQMSLETGDTFYMNRQFSDLVDHARQTIPDDLAFETAWLQSKRAWMWIETPFLVPSISVTQARLQKIKEQLARITKSGILVDEAKLQAGNNQEIRFSKGTPIEDVEEALNAIIEKQQVFISEHGDEKLDTKISAISWFPIPAGNIGKPLVYAQGQETGKVLSEGSVEFLCYLDYNQFLHHEVGFGCWSYFHIQDGDRLIDRVREFEGLAQQQSTGAYAAERATEMLHEIRWVYAAIYLMAQRLATTVTRPTNHAMRKLAKRENIKPPEFIRTVTLRRLEVARVEAAKTGKKIDWQWQWSVRGHWRNQYYHKTGEHKPVFIESYVKGPQDKPLKPPTHTLFIAKR